MTFKESYNSATQVLTVTGTGEIGALQTYKSSAIKIECIGNFIGIGNNAFRDYTVVREIIIPDTIEYIADNVIGYSNCLVNFSIPMKVNNITIAQPFDWNYNIQNIFVDKRNMYFTDVNGVLYTKNMKRLMFYPGGKPDTIFYVPDRVESIALAAMAFSNNLETIVFPPSIKSIESWFAYSLQKINSIIINQCKEKVNLNTGKLLENVQQNETIIHYSSACVPIRVTCKKQRKSQTNCIFLVVIHFLC